MIVKVIQPEYSFNYIQADKCFDKLLKQIDSIKKADIIVIPEYSDIPVAGANSTEFHDMVKKYNSLIKEKCKQTAIRCNSMVFFNASDLTEKGNINTTYALDRKGNIFGKYQKAHPAPSEFKTFEQGGNGCRVDYSYEFNKPYIVENEGIRFGFMTCYDFYFYESFARLARENVDIIIGCSHQRSDKHYALDLINRFLCYNTNAFLLRASVSLGKKSELGGCSCIIKPDGNVIVDLKNKVGIATADIDIKDKYYKPAGFRGKPKSHYEYIEEGRHPQNYRPAGSAIVNNDIFMRYPRVCSLGIKNDGLSVMASLGGAIGENANELALNVSVSENALFVNGEKIENIFKKYSCHAVFNIFLTGLSKEQTVFAYREIVKLSKIFDNEKYIYFTLNEKDADCLAGLNKDFPLCLVLNDKKIKNINAQKVLLDYDFSVNDIKKLKNSGLKVLAKENEKLSARELVKMGVDCVISYNVPEIN